MTLFDIITSNDLLATNAPTTVLSAQTMISAVMQKAVNWSIIACKGLMGANAFYSLVAMLLRDK